MRKGPITNKLFRVESVVIVERGDDGETIERCVSGIEFLRREKFRLEQRGDRVAIVERGPRCWLTREGK